MGGRADFARSGPAEPNPHVMGLDRDQTDPMPDHSEQDHDAAERGHPKMTATAPPAGRRWVPSALALLLANAVPLLGVLFSHWTVFSVVLLYWCENVVVGAFNVLRMLCAQPRNAPLWAGKLFLIPFFMFHYGMFTFVHGIFVFTLFGGGLAHADRSLTPRGLLDALQQAGLGYAVLALVASHGVSFFHNYLGGGEYSRVGLDRLMTRPYARVVVLHLTILGGGFLVLLLRSPLPALLVLIALKTAIDLRAHLAERQRFGVASTP